MNPQQVNYITGLDYTMDVFGKPRPSNTVESGNVFFNLTKSILAKTLLLGFSQVCTSKDIRNYMEKGVHDIQKTIETFASLLHQENIHTPKLMDTEVTDSTISPFSEKLMLYNIGFLAGIEISYYGTALVTSMRVDIAAHCETAILRILKGYAMFGQLMIKNHWLEEPPKADDRKMLKE